MTLSPQIKMAVLKDNLNAQHYDIQKLSKLRLAYFDDFARIANDFLTKCKCDGMLIHDALLLLREHCKEEIKNVLPLKDACILSAEDRYTFSHLRALRLLNDCPLVLAQLFPSHSSHGGRVAFVKNRTTEVFFERAKEYRFFQQSIYANDFKDAIFKVLENEADFCLLPYAEKRYLPIYGVIDAILKSDLRLLGLIQQEDLTYGIFGKHFSFNSVDSCVLQYAAPYDVSIPHNIESKIKERFSYQIDNRHYKVDTLQVENLEFIISCLLFFELLQIKYG